MKTLLVALLPVCFLGPLFGQQAPGSASAQMRLYQYASASRALSNQGGAPQITVFPGDLAIPQFVNGGSWSTSVSLINMSSVAEGFSLLFVTDSGGPLQVPLIGLGSVTMVEGTLTPGQCITYETDGSGGLRQGWALLLPDDMSVARIGGFAVFRQRVVGRPDFEAVVPVGYIADKKAVLLYDNSRGFSTGVALVNADPDNAITVTLAFRDENGNVYATQTLSMQSMTHTAFSMPDQFPATKGRRGSVLLSSSGRALTALGLRFNPSGAFTSFHTLNTNDMLR